MLVLALAGLLAALAAETLPRVPGMRFRLGMEESAVLALGSFVDAKVPEAGTMAARRGPTRFFGVPGEATLFFQDGRLAGLRFEATGVSSHSQDYVIDQLRRMQYARGCERDERDDRECDWTGPAVRVHTSLKKDRLVASVERWPPPPEPPAEDSVAASPGAAARGSAEPVRSVPAPAPPQADPVRKTSTPSESAARNPATAAARPKPAASADPPPARPPAAVVTLPETLTISLASRNAPDVWPRIVSSPTLHYPEAARRESVQGVVWVMAVVDPTGQVIDAWIDRGLPELETSALAWVSRSKFAPCERNGAPCRFHVRVAVLFTLH